MRVVELQSACLFHSAPRQPCPAPRSTPSSLPKLCVTQCCCHAKACVLMGALPLPVGAHSSIPCVQRLTATYSNRSCANRESSVATRMAHTTSTAHSPASLQPPPPQDARCNACSKLLPSAELLLSACDAGPTTYKDDGGRSGAEHPTAQHSTRSLDALAAACWGLDTPNTSTHARLQARTPAPPHHARRCAHPMHLCLRPACNIEQALWQGPGQRPLGSNVLTAAGQPHTPNHVQGWCWSCHAILHTARNCHNQPRRDHAKHMKTKERLQQHTGPHTNTAMCRGACRTRRRAKPGT